MTKRIKKPIIHLVTILLILLICNYIGQNYVKEKDKPTENDEVELEDNVISYIDNLNKVEIIGNYNTSDNPWGYAIGEINYEDKKSLLLTPNTGIQFTSEKQFTKIIIDAYLHPWVKSNSDGADLLITIVDIEGKILLEKIIKIGQNESYLLEIGEDDYDKGSLIEITCGNGGNNDDQNDWLVIERLELYSD